MRDCEDYVQKNGIQTLLRDCIVQLCVAKPDNPVSFLRGYFQNLEREQLASDPQAFFKRAESLDDSSCKDDLESPVVPNHGNQAVRR